jgi:hypothetical protein
MLLAVLGVLSLRLESQARPNSRSRTHRCTVVLESVDVTNRVIRATSIGGHSRPLAFFWKKDTRFYKAAKPMTPAELQVGQKVSVVHRQPFFGPWRLETLFAAQ